MQLYHREFISLSMILIYFYIVSYQLTVQASCCLESQEDLTMVIQIMTKCLEKQRRVSMLLESVMIGSKHSLFIYF